MKTSINNRKLWLDRLTKWLYAQGTLTEKELVERYTLSILEHKKHSSTRNIQEGSNKYIKSLVDAKERAIASISMYYHAHKIKCRLGFLYIISCDSFPNYYKIGYSKDAETRLNSYQTCSPHRDFKLLWYLATEDAGLAETIAKKYLSSRLKTSGFILRTFEKITIVYVLCYVMRLATLIDLITRSALSSIG